MRKNCLYPDCQQYAAPGDKFFCGVHRASWREYCMFNEIEIIEAYAALAFYVGKKKNEVMKK